MEIKIYVPDEYQERYKIALAKLKADKYEDKLPIAEKDVLELDVARIVALEKLEQKMVNISEGENPYDYFYNDTFFDEVSKRINDNK